ncbi:MAG TPA: CotH kinase family protein, partial [Verrucomicrobiae bacterium]
MTRTKLALVAFLFVCSGVLRAAETFPIFSTNATWRLFKGRAEASTPDITTWRSNSFNDVAFVNAAAPFTYGEAGYGYGTDMTDMLNGYNCFFLRRTFEITNKAQIAALEMVAKVDDGFVVWINGAEQRRVNMAGATGDPVTTNTLSTGAPSEPVPYVSYTFAGLTNLVDGTNVIAVQVFNTTLASTDIVFDSLLNAILTETNPPTIVTVTPTSGSVLDNLTQITVQFSEPVAGVNADDLNVHGIGATGISGGPTTYTFTFPPAPYGDVPIIWTSGHGIADLATPPNSFNETLPGATWNYTLADNVPPIVTNLFPASNAIVRVLGQIEVAFNETVVGVNASDLLINGQPATNVIALLGSAYLFQFPQQAVGSVAVQWAGAHGIVDTAPTPIPFGGGSWNYTVDPNANVGGLVINEINVSNENGIRDEDAEAEDWIELYNGGTNSVNLAGWSLSDQLDEPGQWIFPTKVLLPGQYLVVFASGKDRRAPTGTNRFHTNFKLSGDGEFLGLFTPDSPRQFASGFSPKFPFQRTDYSYGNELGGNLRYFATPTPGASNGVSSINGVVEPVHFSTSRGNFTQPFNLVLSCATRSSFIRYTTNGTEPTAVNGFLYSGPLSVNGTLFMRAAAFATNKVPSTTDSHSFFFNQTAAIRSLPIVSVQTASNNMTGTNGIIGMQGGTGPPANPWTAVLSTDYYNPTKTGIAWERPMSVEYIRADNSGFQADCGMRVQGSDYTRPRYEATSKFSYRLYFRGDYGKSKLEYPLFEDSVVQNFEQIVMRAGHNDISNPFLRDELVRQLHADMGQVACHGAFVNFFINGVYKGYYNPCERVEEGFLQNWHGGGSSWDILTVGSAVQGGDNVFWNAMRSYISGQDVTQPTVFTEIMNRLDVVNFIDYLIVNVYGASWDWPHNNWRAARERVPNGKFRFYIWDAEGAFGLTGRAASNFDSFSTTDSGLLTATAEIPTLYQRLRNSPEFRLLWADRVHKHFYNNGAMSDTNVANRFIQMRAQLLGVLPGIDNSILNTWVPQRRAPLL